MGRAISVTELLTKRRKLMKFEGVWKETMGCPELRGSIIVYGDSGNGKTRFVCQFCKYLTHFERVLLNSFEEGDSETLKQAFIDAGMEEVKHRIQLLDGEPLDELIDRLDRHKSPNVVVIDSVQYCGITYPQYKALRKRFPNKLFIWISHAQGKLPEGRTAQRIRFDCNVKIRVEGYRAFCQSRYGSTKPYYTIWEEGAAKYWAFPQNSDK